MESPTLPGFFKSKMTCESQVDVISGRFLIGFHVHLPLRELYRLLVEWFLRNGIRYKLTIHLKFSFKGQMFENIAKLSYFNV